MMNSLKDFLRIRYKCITNYGYNEVLSMVPWNLLYRFAVYHMTSGTDYHKLISINNVSCIPNTMWFGGRGVGGALIKIYQEKVMIGKTTVLYYIKE